MHLAELPTLADLNLCETNLSNEGLSHLKHCQGLQVIGLSATLVNDVGLAHLAQLPNLHILDLSDTIVGDAGIKQLGRFDRFTQLGLARSWCYRRAIQLVSTCSKLAIPPARRVCPRKRHFFGQRLAVVDRGRLVVERRLFTR